VITVLDVPVPVSGKGEVVMNPTKPTPNSQFTRRLLAQSSVKSSITAPVSSIDITEWLFNVDEHEYINCTPKSKAHLPAGFTHAPDGKRMSINVEDVGGALFLEHYVEDISEKLRCRVVSTSDVLIGREYTTVHLIWELIATPLDDTHSELVNNVWIYTTEEYDQYLTAHEISYEQAKEICQTNTDAHNAEETPYFAAAIQRKALNGKD
jgi:hypothetical protein